MNRLFAGLLLLAGLLACTPPSEPAEGGDAAMAAANPAAPGFNAAASDSMAIAIADSVMAALGSRRAWDQTRYIQWTFFGFRHLLWDKQQQRVRIEVPADSLVYLVQLAELGGQVYRKGQPLTEPDTLAHYLQEGRSIWINDSYWLLMPFKLKDSGVTLTYVGEDSVAGDPASHLLQLTFDEVGDTPQNKYRVWVSQDDYLVNRWAFYADASDEKPRFNTLWKDFRPYGSILLSGNRGQRKLENIAVYEAVADSLFEVPGMQLPLEK